MSRIFITCLVFLAFWGGTLSYAEVAATSDFYLFRVDNLVGKDIEVIFEGSLAETTSSFSKVDQVKVFIPAGGRTKLIRSFSDTTRIRSVSDSTSSASKYVNRKGTGISNITDITLYSWNQPTPPVRPYVVTMSDLELNKTFGYDGSNLSLLCVTLASELLLARTGMDFPVFQVINISDNISTAAGYAVYALSGSSFAVKQEYEGYVARSFNRSSQVPLSVTYLVKKGWKQDGRNMIALSDRLLQKLTQGFLPAELDEASKRVNSENVKELAKKMLREKGMI